MAPQCIRFGGRDQPTNTITDTKLEKYSTIHLEAFLRTFHGGLFSHLGVKCLT